MAAQVDFVLIATHFQRRQEQNEKAETKMDIIGKLGNNCDSSYAEISVT